MIQHAVNNDSRYTHEHPGRPDPPGQASMPVESASDCSDNDDDDERNVDCSQDDVRDKNGEI